MAIKTTLQQLEEVQAAITKILEYGQDVTKAEKRILRARLSHLTKREDDLLVRYRAETGTGGASINVGIIKRSI